MCEQAWPYQPDGTPDISRKLTEIARYSYEQTVVGERIRLIIKNEGVITFSRYMHECLAGEGSYYFGGIANIAEDEQSDFETFAQKINYLGMVKLK
ncbi:MAG: hypothetical protein O2840_03365 [bacterium]|nr:hypothetical protein [bacterium]